jgi:hypothetical protein
MDIDTKENRCWPSLGWIFRPDEFRLEGLSREEATSRWLSGCNEFTQLRIPVTQLGMESPFGATIDSLCGEARRTAEDWGAERAAGIRDGGHWEVRAEDSGERGDLMARSDSDSADDEAEDERVILVSVKPMPQRRLHPPGRASSRRLTWQMVDWREAPVAIQEGERETDPGVGAEAEQIHESDTEHKDLPVEHERWPRLLAERTNRLRNVLHIDGPRDARERLKRFLRTMECHESRLEKVRPTTLGDPVLLIPAQHKAYRTCRLTMFCPADGCTKRMANVSRLMEYLRRDHGVREEDTQDLVRFFIATMLPGRLKVNLQRTNGTQVRGE